MMRAAGCWLAVLAATLLLLYALIGCAARMEYAPAPAWLIPAAPPVVTVRSEALQCLSDDTYIRLVQRDRACWQYARELRVLLGAEAP